MLPIASLTEYPRRIICLTEETTETLYLLGQQDRIVGVSGYTVRPKEARLKPKVSAFINANFDKIMALQPELVLAFSDLQADITAELLRRGIQVFTFNQRSVTEILQMILTLGRLVGSAAAALALVERLQNELEALRQSALRFPKRPRVYFEEWYDPLISGIRWVEELIEIAGGECVFPELRHQPAAPQRIITAEAVLAANPDVIIASWCGRPVRKATLRQRPGWQAITAVQRDHLFEIKSTYILQPGPAALTEGVRQLHALLAYTLQQPLAANLRPQEKGDAARLAL